MELVSYKFHFANNQSKPLAIMPLGDVQWSGHKGDTTLRLLLARIAYGLEHDAYFVGMGDYIDFMSPSNRQRFRSAALYDSAEDVVDEKALELTQELYEVALKPTTGRWLGLLEGHHFSQLKSGMTTDQHLCHLLKAPFLGTCAYIRLQFQNGKGRRRSVVNLWCHHGTGSGKAGAPIAKLENLCPYWEADVFLMGHMTKQATAPVNRIYPAYTKGGGSLTHRKIYLVGTGGFSRGYTASRRDGAVPRGNYVEQRMLNPTALGCPLLLIKPIRARRKHTDRFEIELTVEV